MQKRDGEILFSAGDVVTFMECEHATTLALADLDTPLARARTTPPSSSSRTGDLQGIGQGAVGRLENLAALTSLGGREVESAC